MEDQNSINKKRLHHTWTMIRQVKPWYFLILAVVSIVICVAALRANNLQMIELRQAVYTADESGNDIETPLRKLREHVYGHMNTNLSSGPNGVHPPIQLKYTYERFVKAQQASVGETNGAVYTEAQQYCERTIPNGVSGGVRLGCIQSYVKQRSPATAESVPKSLYQFDFVSPTWSPDVAGWSMVAAIASLLAALSLGIYQGVIKGLLRR